MAVDKLLGSKKSLAADPISGLTQQLSQITASRTYTDESIGKLVVAAESFGSSEESVVTSAYNSFENTIQSIVRDFGVAVEDYQIEAATIAGMVATAPSTFLTAKPKLSNQASVVLAANSPDAHLERPSIALEAYDERENRNAQLFAIVYNLLASRQDDFGETFFPTIVINPNEIGATVSIKLFYAYNDFKRSVNGSLANYGRKNIVRAYSDANVLKNELTRAIPVLRVGGPDDNTAAFVAATDVTPWSADIGAGFSVPTSALRVDTKVDLIGISQTNELLNSGLMGPTDNLDAYVRLESVFVRFTDGTNTDVVRLNVESFSGSVFTYAPQGNYRKMILNLDTDGVVLTENSTNVAGGAVASLAPEIGSGRKARLQLIMRGDVSLDKGDCIVNRGTLGLVALRDATDNLVTGTVFNSLATKIASAEVIGYTLIAYRANSNVRQRGQLLDTQVEYRSIPVPYRSPLAALMPVAITNTDDTSMLQTLITATGIRVSNEAVSTLIKTQQALANYAPVATATGDLPEIGIFGHYYVKPTYYFEAINLANVVDSLKSHERIKDIRAAIVEKIRYYANEMYKNSEYKAAAMVLTGNTGFKPTVIVGTDPVIYNYIVADGDLRTLGDSFDVKVVSTLDSRVSGKIFVSFGVFDASRNTAINPLNFGNMLYAPEIPVVLPNAARDGQISKELIVTARFQHIMNLPVLTVLEVQGLPSVVNKTAVNFRNV